MATDWLPSRTWFEVEWVQTLAYSDEIERSSGPQPEVQLHG